MSKNKEEARKKIQYAVVLPRKLILSNGYVFRDRTTQQLLKAYDGVEKTGITYAQLGNPEVALGHVIFRSRIDNRLARLLKSDISQTGRYAAIEIPEIECVYDPKISTLDEVLDAETLLLREKILDKLGESISDREAMQAAECLIAKTGIRHNSDLYDSKKIVNIANRISNPPISEGSLQGRLF